MVRFWYGNCCESIYRLRSVSTILLSLETSPPSVDTIRLRVQYAGYWDRRVSNGLHCECWSNPFRPKRNKYRTYFIDASFASRGRVLYSHQARIDWIHGKLLCVIIDVEFETPRLPGTRHCPYFYYKWLYTGRMVKAKLVCYMEITFGLSIIWSIPDMQQKLLNPDAV